MARLPGPCFSSGPTNCRADYTTINGRGMRIICIYYVKRNKALRLTGCHADFGYLIWPWQIRDQTYISGRAFEKKYRVGMDVRNLELARLLLTQSAFRQN